MRWAVGAGTTFLNVELLTTGLNAADDEFGWIVGHQFVWLGDERELDNLVVDAADSGIR